MKKSQLKGFADHLRDAAKIIDTFAEEAVEFRDKYRTIDTAVMSVSLRAYGAGYGGDRADVSIDVLLQNGIGLFRKEEKRANDRLNDRARAFAKALLSTFRVKGTRPKDDNPQVLRLTLPTAVIDLHGYPTEVKFVCEKQCVAILPNGKKVPLSEVPQEI